MEFDPIEEVIAAYGRGEIVIITDDENRENEGDLIAAAAKTDAATVNFMLIHARGLFCVPLAPEIAPRGVAVQESYCRDLPLIEADPKRLFQVFYNLIRNAYQSIPGPDGCILVLTGYNDTDVRICISDTGTGISHEVMGNMYEPFHTTKKHGNGLGLLIVRHIVREHGGTLGIASREGQGTAVTVTLPRADRVVRLLPQ